MYEDDEEQDQTKAPGMRGSNPAPEQRGAPMMQTTSMGAPGDIRTMAAPGGMGGGMGGGRPMPQMPWHQQQQGQPDWGSILQRFRQRFQQHNPFMQRMGGQQQPGGPAVSGPAQGAAPGGAPMQGPPQGANPWADRIAAAAQRFGGNRQPGGIVPPGRGY